MYEGEDGHEQEYCGIIQNIIKLDYQRFDVFVFNVGWFKDVLDKVPQGSITVDGSGFTMIDSTRICSASEGTFILPSHCEQATARFAKISVLIMVYTLNPNPNYWCCCVMQAIFQPLLHK
jgi:hypothetical protein